MRLRVLTYNVHKCIGGLDRQYDPTRVHETIAHHDPDLVLLQEVDNAAKRSGYHRQVDVLGDLLGYSHRTWFANVNVRGGGEYGNAILSRLPHMRSRNIDLTIGWRKRRSALHARYRLPHRVGGADTLHVFNMHLGLSGGERKKQLRLFLSELAEVEMHEPVIVAGDFNDVWGTLGKILKGAGFRGPGRGVRTFPAYAPIGALDRVFVRGSVALRDLQSSRLAVAKSASDHLPLVADIELGAG